MKIVFIGHVSVDINVIAGKERVEPGGGVVHGAITARRLGAQASIVTRCAEADRPMFQAPADADVDLTFLSSAGSTSIRNEYPTANPDDRVSRLVSRADVFTQADLDHAAGDVLHVNPLWAGEFPPELLAEARQRARVLGADAQGFLRHAAPDGRLEHRPWADAARFLPLLDVFKVDWRESEILVGKGTPVENARRVLALGPASVVLTHRDGVVVCDASGAYEAPFVGWTVEGRTGRGDTCTAAFLVARERMSAADAAAFAGRVTSEKMRYAGPFRGAA